jgi:hypothetical protein
LRFNADDYQAIYPGRDTGILFGLTKIALIPRKTNSSLLHRPLKKDIDVGTMDNIHFAGQAIVPHPILHFPRTHLMLMYERDTYEIQFTIDIVFAPDYFAFLSCIYWPVLFYIPCPVLLSH